MPINTVKTRNASWNGWLRWTRAHRHAPLKPTPLTVLAYIEHLAESSPSGRPDGIINNFKSLLSMLADISPAAFDLNLPKHERDATWIPKSVMSRAIVGVIRSHTLRPVRKQAYLDMPRVLESLRAEAEPLLNAGGRPEDFRLLRNLAIASFCAVVPSRAEELAGLQQRDIGLYVPVSIIGVQTSECKVHTLGADYLQALLQDAGTEFHFIVNLRRSKTDPLMAGIPKRLQHAAGSEWSPARVILAAIVASRRLLGKNFADERTPLFHQTENGIQAANPPALAPATVSRILADRARIATGEKSISSRGWRPAAASWLLACGVDKNTVVALGGWSSAKSLRKFYVRHLPMTRDRLITLYGALPSAGESNPRHLPAAPNLEQPVNVGDPRRDDSLDISDSSSVTSEDSSSSSDDMSENSPPASPPRRARATEDPAVLHAVARAQDLDARRREARIRRLS